MFGLAFRIVLIVREIFMKEISSLFGSFLWFIRFRQAKVAARPFQPNVCSCKILGIVAKYSAPFRNYFSDEHHIVSFRFIDFATVRLISCLDIVHFNMRFRTEGK